MTPDWTKLRTLFVLAKCRYYTWLQVKESVSETSIRDFLHDRRSHRELAARSKHSSKWHSLTTAFTKLMTPSVDDLHVAGRQADLGQLSILSRLTPHFD